MNIEDLTPGTLVLLELSYEYREQTFYSYERAAFHGLVTHGPDVRALFEEKGYSEWEAYFTDDQWFRADEAEPLLGESVESVRLVEVLS